eukprot:CAMPEP_0202687608 /NCGR_PEP_ID=MMETSP1385-20130828/3276_1 /ASSEMBLY_ACC=CAM_ASM_000861 /TAXON_ID=933848 /ORGANISM="Elphidium margaritaceum" /LENGTH=456 /DNA_ID=CAMNT_0049342433 /DNA_START=48 /DNA_END=1418 /DNA_ORIENTATION=-
MSRLLLSNAYKRKPIPSFKLHHAAKRFASKGTSQDLESSGSPAFQRAVELEKKFGANNYHPIPVVLSRGEGAYVWDVDGRRYFDFLSAYSAVNQGHCHPKIVQTLQEQSKTLTLTSRAFYNDTLGEYCQFVADYFNYPRVLPMNTGVEACYSTLKIARKWGYEVKGIPENQGRLVFAANNFWGRSFGAVSSSTDPVAYNNFGPFLPNMDIVPYDDVQALEQHFAAHADTIAAYMCEPIQGEAGVIIPSETYLQRVRQLCDKYNVLWIADEVQTGLGRTGQRLCVDWQFEINGQKNNGPDLISLGKALSGGVYPVSAALARTDEIMDVLTPGTHGSTYGGNPIACKVAMTALTVLKEEGMIENSRVLGELLLQELQKLAQEFELIECVRGKGLFCAMQIAPNHQVDAWNVCMKLRQNGLLAKPTHDDIIRLSPPLVITEQQIYECVEILRNTLKSLP